MNKAAEKAPLVLVCPLNWGLGHATRCVPVIEALLKKSCRVMVLADGPPLVFLQEYFGERLTFRVLPGRAVRYSPGRNQTWVMLKQLPGLLWSVCREHRLLRHILRETDASFLISDNRYGLFHQQLKCVFMTHQLFIRLPQNYAWLTSVVHFINHWFIRKYALCWVPDRPGKDNLSGALAHQRPVKGVRFTGSLSRFSAVAQAAEFSPLPIDFPSSFYLVMLSGPEPQRSLLEEKLLDGFRESRQAVVFVRGFPGRQRRDPERATDRMLLLDHAPDAQLAWLIRHSRLVVCRPGYSGMMDLAVFGKKALVIPTPGQTEQEYLAAYMEGQSWVGRAEQHSLILEEALMRAGESSGIPPQTGLVSLLDNAIDELLGL